ncbi:MAG TPA: DUF5011 domain-containing protein [Candidatus Hydrogenedentes bacterium]|nr:DUF5011 domain-containing protein [Candidatus Hydrogenedentota bacterium]
MKKASFLSGVVLFLGGVMLAVPWAAAELVFSSSFTTLPGTVILTGNAYHDSANGNIHLTNDGQFNQVGTLLLPRPNKPLPTLSINFAGYIGGATTPDGTGMCVAYGPIPDDAVFGNDYTPAGGFPGLRVKFYTALNRFQIYYNGVSVLNSQVSDGTLRYNGFRQYHITVTAEGRCSVYQDGRVRAQDVALPGWNPQADWRVAFGGSTSATSSDNHWVDSLSVSTSEPRPISITRRDPTPVGGATMEIGYNVTFSEAMRNLDPADFTLTTLAGNPLANTREVTTPTYRVQETFSGSAGVGTLTGSANVSSSVLRLTTGGGAPESGGWYFQPPSAMRSFYAAFKLYCGTDGAGTQSGEGAWFGYAPNANNYQTIAPTTNPGLYILFDTNLNGSEVAPSIAVYSNGVPRAYSRENIAGNWIDVAIGVDDDGLCTVTVNGRPICGSMQLPGWNPQADWYFGLAGFATLQRPYAHYVDDFVLHNSTRQVILDTLSGEGVLRLDLLNATAEDMFGASLLTNTYSTGHTYELDFVPPVITPTGPGSVTLECGVDTYAEFGATAYDNRDGDLTAAIVIDASAVNTGTPGVYLVSYQVADSLGNQATAYRIVIVQDTLHPVLSLVGGSSVLAQCHFTFNDPGVVAIDTCDGTLPVTVTGLLDTNTPGDYTLTYTATDSAGHSAQISRQVSVVDTIPPAIGAPYAIGALCGEPLTLPDRFGYDQCAGVLPARVVDLGSLDLNSPTTGVYSVAYEADDGVNVTTNYMTVYVDDMEPPVLVLHDTSPILAECGVPIPYPDLTVTDNCANPVPLAWEFYYPGTNPNAPVEGTYLGAVVASDGSSEVWVPDLMDPPIQITVVDTLPPNITLNGDADMVLDCGQVYVEPGGTAMDLCEGDVTTTMEIQSAVPEGFLPPGTWTVTYKARDSKAQEETVIRTVTVLDNCTLRVNLVSPDQVTVVEETPVTLEVQVEGAVGTANLQWYRNLGAKAWEPIPDATDTTLVFDPVSLEDAGLYYCEATDLVTTVQSPQIRLIVDRRIPAAGISGLALLSIGLAVLGARHTRKR